MGWEMGGMVGNERGPRLGEIATKEMGAQAADARNGNGAINLQAGFRESEGRYTYLVCLLPLDSTDDAPLGGATRRRRTTPRNTTARGRMVGTHRGGLGGTQQSM